MNRRTFIGIAGGSLLVAGAGSYLLSDRSNLVRDDLGQFNGKNGPLKPDEREILYLASLAPSGHNTQPWFVQYIEPYHWIIGNDKSRWLPSVDPTQRETILSIGAFVQNLDYAANSLGYAGDWTLLAKSNQDEQILDVKLNKKAPQNTFDIATIKARRTLRSGYLSDILKKEDAEYLFGSDSEFIHYLPFASKESSFINEQTVEANRLQTYRDEAQRELAEWIRFSGKEAEKYRDGLTTASMEIEGVAGWFVRNFYGKADVIKPGFRQTGLDRVNEQVSRSAGWLLITSKDASVSSLLEAGMRMQGVFLKVRERNIAIHPMTQVLEEEQTRQDLNRSVGLGEDIDVQFILRTGYLKDYPPPVSLRRPVEWFIRQ